MTPKKPCIDKQQLKTAIREEIAEIKKEEEAEKNKPIYHSLILETNTNITTDYIIKGIKHWYSKAMYDKVCEEYMTNLKKLADAQGRIRYLEKECELQEPGFWHVMLGLIVILCMGYTIYNIILRFTS